MLWVMASLSSVMSRVPPPPVVGKHVEHSSSCEVGGGDTD